MLHKNAMLTCSISKSVLVVSVGAGDGPTPRKRGKSSTPAVPAVTAVPEPVKVEEVVTTAPTPGETRHH